MSLLVDDVVVGPKEALPDGIEASLSAAGLSIKGANFGEAVKKGTLVKTATGVVMVDREPEVRTVVLQLECRPDSGVTLPEAAYRLEQIVGYLQERDRWFRRDFHVGGEFGALLYHVSGEVTLADFAGWQAGDSPDVTLTMVCDFAAYSTVEVKSAEFKEETKRQLIATIAETGGSTEGLERWEIKNLGAADWRGLIFAKECRDYSAATTAEPFYEAQKLTPKGGAEVKEVSGAKVVQHTALTAGWLTILGSEISGVGHMTHRGARRMLMRIFDPGATAGGVQLRLLWRALGASRWVEDNPIISTPLVGNYALVDLGGCRPQVASRGNERWEWALQARAPSGSGAIRVRDVYPLPTEQYLELSEPSEPLIAGEPVKSPGTMEDNSGVGTISWSNVNNAKVADGVYATAALTLSSTSHYLKATNFGFALPEAATVKGIKVEILRKSTIGTPVIGPRDNRVRIVKGGSIKEAEDKASPEMWPHLAAAWKEYGGAKDLWGNTWAPSDINSSTFGVALSVKMGEESDTASVDAFKITVYYTEGADEDRVCFASRSVEIRSNGVDRQAITDDVWGGLVPDGFYPKAIPSGQEGRPSRVIVIASQGDLDTLPDTGSNKLSAVDNIRSGHHSARGAT